MKNLLINNINVKKAVKGSCFMLAFLVGVTPASADELNDAYDCLQVIDIPCAQKKRDRLLAEDPTDEAVLSLHAKTLFYEGRYVEMEPVLHQLKYPEEDDESKDPYRATIDSARGLKESMLGNIVVRHGDGVEYILADEALETLQASQVAYTEIFGGIPQHQLVMDIYPTASRFIGASGLPPEAVRTTGVIALSKWSRLLLTSPKALSRGYGWKDTTAHEYIHLVVAWRTKDRAPVWLQEGLAKYFEGAWRGEKNQYLSVYQQGLLAGALQKDQFVPFEKFKYSMAYLDSGEEAALAFAQVSTMMAYLESNVGLSGFSVLMDRVKAGEEPGAVVADLAGYTSFEEFQQGWKGFIRQLPLVRQKLAALPVTLDGGDEFADDPLLAQRMDLTKFVRLGDLLMQIERPKAALIEYNKVEEEEIPSPTLLSRKAQCYIALNKYETALDIVNKGVGFYPEFALLWVTKGQVHMKMGNLNEATAAYKMAHDLNPFNPEVQDALIKGYTSQGNEKMANRHRRYATILKTGGAVTQGDLDDKQSR